MEKRCPECGALLENIGDIGIGEWDGRWTLQATRYVCKGERPHMIFATEDAEGTLDLEAEAAEG